MPKERVRFLKIPQWGQGDVNMSKIKIILIMLVVWYGLMLGCCLVMCKNDFVTIRAVTKAVMLHDVKFLTANCNYKKARILCTILFVGTVLIGNIVF